MTSERNGTVFEQMLNDKFKQSDVDKKNKENKIEHDKKKLAEYVMLSAHLIYPKLMNAAVACRNAKADVFFYYTSDMRGVLTDNMSKKDLKYYTEDSKRIICDKVAEQCKKDFPSMDFVCRTYEIGDTVRYEQVMVVRLQKE